MGGYLTTDEIAQRLGVKVETVRRWVRQGKVPGFPLGRAGYRIQQEDFERFVQDQQFRQLTRSASASSALSPQVASGEESRMEAVATLILERMTDGVVLFDADGRCQYANASAAQLLGVMPDDLSGKTMVDILPGEHTLSQEAEEGHEDFFSAATGRWFQVRAFAALHGRCLSFLDVSERKQLEAQLREGKQLFTTLVEHLPDVVFRLDLHLRHIYISPAIELITGQPVEDWLGKTGREMGLPAKVCDRFEAICQQAIMTQEAQQMEFEHNGYWHRSRILPECTPGDSVNALMGITEDITERKQHELNAAFLAELEQDFRRTLSLDDLLEVVGSKMIRYFGVSRLTFAQVNEAVNEFIGIYDTPGRGVETAVGIHQIHDYMNDEYLHEFKAGGTIIVNDIVTDPRTASYAHAYERFHVRAQLMVPHLTDGQLDFIIAMQHHEPYQWRADEIELVQELAAYISPQIERFRAEEALRASRAEIERQRSFFETILGNINGFVYVWNREKQFIYANQALERLWGIEHGAAVGKTTADLAYPPELSKLLERDVEQVFETGTEVSGEVPYTSPGGVSGYYDYIYSPILGAEGTVELVAGISQDTTERRRMEQALRDSEQRFRTLADAMPQLAWSARSDGAIDFFNERLHEYAEISRNEEGDYEWQALIHPDDREATIRDWEEATRTGDAFEHEQRLYMRDGTYRWHLVRGVPIRDAAGAVVRWYGTKTDIEQIKQLEQQKTAFLGMVNHELNTPVTSAKAFAELLERRFRKAGDEKNAALLGKMHTQMDKLARLIGDLLEVTRIEAGQLKFHAAFFAFDELVEDIVEEVQYTTTHLIQREGGTGATIYGDRERIGQVLINLLTNAIKYSPNATRVVVTTTCNQHQAMLSVQDFGIGIAQDKLAHVFERFYREDGRHENTFSGLGLGLYVSAEIMQRQGGKIWAESEKGQGSTFYFSLPLQDSKGVRQQDELFHEHA